MRRQQEGFSIVELLIALGLTATTLALVFSALAPSGGLFASGGEAADVQQRLRAATDALSRDLLNAGAGEAWGDHVGPLLSSTAPVLPYLPSTAGDPPGTFRTDAVTLVYTSSDPSQTRVRRTYFTARDPETGAPQLVRDDGDGVRTPVVNHVVHLAFEYFGDPRPPRMRRPLTDPDGPSTTYGPPPLTTATALYRPGENCIFVAEEDGSSRSRLEELALPGSPGLVRLEASQLIDGPWCPDAADPERFDADLLRIRRIGVVLRIESALTSLRGRASGLFARVGTSRDGLHFVPDVEVRFEVAPRNLNLDR